MIKVIISYYDGPHNREASRMVLPRYGIAQAGNGSILKGPARHFAGSDVTPSLVAEREPEHKKVQKGRR